MKTFLLVAVAILTLSTLIKANNTSTGAEQAYIDSIKASNLKLSKQIDSITVHDQEQSEINNKTEIKDNIISIIILLSLMLFIHKKNKKIQNGNDTEDKKFFKSITRFIFLILSLVLACLTIRLFHLLT